MGNSHGNVDVLLVDRLPRLVTRVMPASSLPAPAPLTLRRRAQGGQKISLDNTAEVIGTGYGGQVASSRVSGRDVIASLGEAPKGKGGSARGETRA